MKKWIKRLLIIGLFCLSGLSVKAQVSVYASSYILMEASSKRVLEGNNINERYLTASICKILTAIIVIENSNIDGYAVVTDDVTRQVGSAVYLDAGDLILVRDLLYGLLLRSGNDCAYLLALYSAGSIENFVSLMNKYAKKIGMKHSTFSNPSGLDDENLNYSTAYDMALLMCYCMENKVFREINGTKRYTCTSLNGKGYCFYNKHKLITGYDHCIGGKTGYTIEAKRTLITYASKNGMELVCVTFNCGDDWNAHLNLFEYGFNNYSMKNVMKRQAIKTKKEYQVTPYLLNDIIIPLKKKEEVEIKIYLLNEIDEELVNQEIGKVVLYVDNNEIYKTYLYPYF